MPRKNYTYPSILEALEQRGDMTSRELAEDLQCSQVTIHDNLRKLRKDGKVHICDWQPPKGKGARAPVYRYGYGRDANWAVQSKEDKNMKKLAWAKSRAMKVKLFNCSRNPFATLIAHVTA